MTEPEIKVGDLTLLRAIQKAQHEKYGDDPVIDQVFTWLSIGEVKNAAYKLRLDFDKLTDIPGIARAILASGLIDQDHFRSYLEKKISKGWDD